MCLALVGLLTSVLLVTGCDRKSTAGRSRTTALPPPTAESTVRRLITPQDKVSPHVFAAQSNFTATMGQASSPERPRIAPELVPQPGLVIADDRAEEHDWHGVVLVPKNLGGAVVSTARVEVQSVEVHPLANGSVRVWARLKNRTGHREKIQIGCAFNTQEKPNPATPKFHEIELPVDFIDVFFVSPKENINAYTFLIRNPPGAPH